MATVLVTGANRGIGLGFAKHYAREGWDVIATAREPDKANDLHALDVEVMQLDLGDEASAQEFCATLVDRPIDLLLSNAGVNGGPEPERELWIETLLVNAVAPSLLAMRLKPNLLAGAQKKAVAISSRMGSIADNSSGGSMIYRSSKAALNAAWHGLAMEWQRDEIAVAMLHPGWVQTDMGGPGAPIDAATSVAGLATVIDTLDIARTGRFWNYTGEELPW